MVTYSGTVINVSSGTDDNTNFSTQYDYNLNETDDNGDASSVYRDIEFEIPFLITVCIFGVLGNSLVCMVYSKHKYRRSNASLYILNLAAADLMTLVVVMFHVTEFYKVTWPILWRYNVQCRIHRLFRFVGFNNTVFTMMAIAIDRFFAVRNPMVFKVRFTVTRTKIIIGSIWVTSIVAAVPVCFMFESFYGGGGKAFTYAGKLPWACKVITPFGPWYRDFKPVYLNIFLFYVPVIITSILYIYIVSHVWKSNRFVRSNMLSGGHIPQRVRNTHWKTAKSLLCVFVVFILCFAPFATYHIVQQYFATALHPEIKNLSLLLPYFNSCLNPVVYSFTNDVFWRAVKQMICRGGDARPSANSTESNCERRFLGAANGNESELRDQALATIGIAFSYDDNSLKLHSSTSSTPCSNDVSPATTRKYHHPNVSPNTARRSRPNGSVPRSPEKYYLKTINVE